MFKVCFIFTELGPGEKTKAKLKCFYRNIDSVGRQDLKTMNQGEKHTSDVNRPFQTGEEDSHTQTGSETGLVMGLG